MTYFILHRLGSALFSILGVSILVFSFIRLVPGDPVALMLGEFALNADEEALRRTLGLDLPIWQQLTNQIIDLSRFDLGTSIHQQRPVTEILLERLPVSFLLAAMSILVAIAVALPVGCIAAAKHRTVWDQITILLASLGLALPSFVLGPLLIWFFSFQLGWFPVSGIGGVSSVVLPALTLGTALSVVLARMLRGSLLEVLQEDYIRAAKCKGLKEWQVFLVHALPNAGLPVLTLLGLQLGALLSGTVITEIVFGWPGLGQLTIEAINSRDYPVLQGCILLISVIYVLVNMLTDIGYSLLDPRIRIDSE